MTEGNSVEIFEPSTYPGFTKLIHEINDQALSHGLRFELPKKSFLGRDRVIFAVYSGSVLQHAEAASIGLMVQAGAQRQHQNLAWNRIGQGERKWLESYSKKVGFQCFVIQVWHNLDSFLVIPFGVLQEIQRFMRTGDFTARKEGENFRLQGQEEYLPWDCRGTVKRLFSRFSRD